MLRMIAQSVRDAAAEANKAATRMLTGVRIPVISLRGVVARSKNPDSLWLGGLNSTLERAFSVPRARAVVLQVNCPGGSAAESSLIHKRIRALADEKKLPVYAFVEDVSASGGYYMSCAADKIYGDDNSIVGSIGVITSSFGLHEFINRYGIERRLFTKGSKKSMLDPFSPLKDEDVERLKRIQDSVFDNFVRVVKDRRRGKLSVSTPADEEAIFSGDVWVGKDAVSRGLLDGIGDMHTVMKQEFGDNLIFMPFRRRSPFGSLFGSDVSSRLDDISEAAARGAVDAVAAKVENEAHWSRYRV